MDRPVGAFSFCRPSCSSPFCYPESSFPACLPELPFPESPFPMYPPSRRSRFVLPSRHSHLLSRAAEGRRGTSQATVGSPCLTSFVGFVPPGSYRRSIATRLVNCRERSLGALRQPRDDKFSRLRRPPSKRTAPNESSCVVFPKSAAPGVREPGACLPTLSAFQCYSGSATNRRDER